MKRILLKKELATNFTKQEYVCFIKILQILNNLHFWLKLRRSFRIKKVVSHEYAKLIELNNYCMGSIVETIKSVIDDKNGIYSIFAARLTKESCSIITELKKKYKEQDPYLKTARQIRDTTAFHFDSREIRKFFVDGECKEDILLGYMTGNHMDDSFFEMPYDFYVGLYTEFLPEGIEKKDVIDWIFKNTTIWLRDLIFLLYEIIYDITERKYMIIKTVDDHYIANT